MLPMVDCFLYDIIKQDLRRRLKNQLLNYRRSKQSLKIQFENVSRLANKYEEFSRETV